MPAKALDPPEKILADRTLSRASLAPTGFVLGTSPQTTAQLWEQSLLAMAVGQAIFDYLIHRFRGQA
ncbi:hypothetical protein BI292_27090 [Pseudomonas sp. 43NM1]|uniref:hypothetical protein n=1 Tax=Pseudomonas sp. 43NM1 TaxID=1904755 RepID=UPI000C322711|nr:hypothetical protein [Pseudomonas sp. 43NM1]PKH30833.1 hypothetical protein BI292_27090 [Pseudomonas sp. 43NM1]